MLSKRMVSHYLDCERHLFDELCRAREAISVIMGILGQDAGDVNPVGVDAPENFGFTSAQLVLIGGVLERGPMALAEMSLSAKTALERDIQKSYLENGYLSLKFPIMTGASTLNETQFKLYFTKDQFRQFIMLLKRINRADSYFQMVLDDKPDKRDGGVDTFNDDSVAFPSFNYILNGNLLRYTKPLSGNIGINMLINLVPNTTTPNIPVLTLGNDYVAQCTILTKNGERKVDPRQLHGSFYALEKNAGGYSFKVL